MQLSESMLVENHQQCVCVLFDSGRQTELEPAARHTQHTPPLDEIHTALSQSEDGGFAGLEGMSCAFSFFRSFSQSHMQSSGIKQHFKVKQVSQSRVCRSLADHMRMLFHRLQLDGSSIRL